MSAVAAAGGAARAGGGNRVSGGDARAQRAANAAAPKIPHLFQRISTLFLPYRRALIITGILVLITAGLTVIGSTIGPYRGTVHEGYDTETGQTVRRDVNAWLLGTDHPFDAVIDIAAAVADPAQPDRIRPEFNAGDGLHVNDAGAKAIADAVDLSLLKL